MQNFSDRRADRLTPEEWQQIKPVLAIALEIDDQVQRAVYLDEVCGTDCRMREQVDRLLHADAIAGAQFMANSPVTQLDAQREQQARLLIGSRVGGYQILDLLGLG